MSYEQQTIVPELQQLLHDEPFKEQLSKIELTYWNQTISIETRGYFYFIEFLIRKAKLKELNFTLALKVSLYISNSDITPIQD